MKVYSFCQPEITKIQNWFNDNYGFIPSRKQVVLFCIHSIREYIPEYAELVRARQKSFKMDQFDITVPKETKDKLYMFLNEYQYTLGPDMSALIAGIVLYRAASLPDMLIHRQQFSVVQRKFAKDSSNVSHKFEEFVKESSQEALTQFSL
jgi:hypothetical protein